MKVCEYEINDQRRRKLIECVSVFTKKTLVSDVSDLLKYARTMRKVDIHHHKVKGGHRLKEKARLGVDRVR